MWPVYPAWWNLFNILQCGSLCSDLSWKLKKTNGFITSFIYPFDLLILYLSVFKSFFPWPDEILLTKPWSQSNRQRYPMTTWPVLPDWAVSTVQGGRLPWTRDQEHTGREFSHCNSVLPGMLMLTEVTEKLWSFVPVGFLLKGSRWVILPLCINRTSLYCWLL